MGAHTYIVLVAFGLKILSVTCDNASANDTMVEELELLIEQFNGQTSRARCILHVGNLVAKSMIKQFDIPRGRQGEDPGEEEKNLRALADGVDIKDYEMIGTIGKDPEKDDDMDGWVDEIALLSAQEKARLENDIRPVRFALTKVSNDLPSSFRDHEVDFLIGAQVVLQDYSFHNLAPPCMGCCLQGGRLEHAVDPARCFNSVELDLRYGGFCNQISTCC